MNKSDSNDSKMIQARGLASQLGMFAEENDIPKDLWDLLEDTIFNYYQVSRKQLDFYLVIFNNLNQEILNKLIKL